MKKSILGNLPRNNASNCPKLKWACNFESGITQGAWVRVLANNYQRTLSGLQDVVPFFGAGAVANIYALPHADVDTEIDTVIQATSMGANGGLRHGAQELYITFNNVVDHVANSRPQAGMQIKRAGTAATDDINEIFFRSRITLPSNFSTALDHTKDDFFVLYDEKTGLYGGNASTGDYRLIVTAINFTAGVYTIRTRGDNSANGQGIIPSVADSNISTGYWVQDVVVPLADGREYILEVYRKKPEKIWTRSTDPADIISGMTGAPYLQDTTTGITKAWLTDVVTGTRYTLCSQIGGQQNGNENLPCSRHFAALLYSGGGDGLPDPGMSVKITGIEFWDSAPLFMGWDESVAVDASLAGGATQPREGTDTLSIDFASSTPTQVIISRNDNPTFAVWPDGAMSEHFTAVTGGLEFSLSLAHMNLGVNTLGIKASYADYRKATDSLSVTIEAVVDPTPTEISVSMLGGLNQTREGRDIFRIDFTEGTPVSVVFARNDNATFAQWPTGNLQAYFVEVSGGLEFDLELTALNLGSNTLSVTATYSDASTATDSLSLVLTEIDAGAVTLGPLPWVATPLASATMFASPTGNDANPGTFASPKTFQGVITAAVPGGVYFLRGGTYPVTDSAHIQAWAEGTAGAPIIFESYPGELAIIDGSGMTPWVGNKRINVSGQYQKFRGLRITGFPENGFLVGTGSHHTTIDGCEIDNCHLSGIMNFNSSDNRYINCHVHDCSDVGGAANGGNADGISVASGSRNYVGNCLVENCSDDGIDSWQSQDTVFEFNIVRGCGLGDGNGNGFKCGGASIGANAMVNNNLAYNNRALGFDVNTGINVTFKNNTSYDNDAQGYGLEPDTICINNVSSGDGSIKYGTGIPTNNSWNIGGTLTFISTVEGNANFLKVTQGGAFDGIGWEYI